MLLTTKNKTAGGAPPPAPRLLKYTAGAAALWVSLATLGRIPLTRFQDSLGAQALLVLIVAVAGAWLWGARKELLGWLVSPPLANLLLITLLLATVAGTVVIQGAPPEEFDARYGDGAWFLRLIGADNVFPSLAFRGFLAMLAVSLVAVVIRRKAWRMSEWGFLLSHGGVVTILAGGLLSSVYGMKGFIDLHEGRSAQAMTLKDAKGNLLAEQVPLGFALRLDKFEIERYPLDYRFYVHEAEEEDYKLASSTPVNEAGRWTPIGKTGSSFRAISIYPDYQVRSEVRETAGPEGTPALQLRLRRDGQYQTVNLLAGVNGRDLLDLRAAKSLVRFVWELDEKNLPVTTATVPERHRIEFRSYPGAPAEEVVVKPGDSLKLADGAYELDVVAYLPDFVYDGKTKQAATRSAVPNNPALKVSLKSPVPGDAREMWLFGLRPDFNKDHNKYPNGPEIAYHYTPAREPAEREVLVVGSTMEVLDYRRGVLTGRGPLRTSGTSVGGLPDVFCEKVLAKAQEIHTPLTKSKEWRNPAAEIEIRTGDQVRRETLLAGGRQALRIGTGETLLVLDKKPDDVKSFRSRVSVLEGANKTREAVISVNNPLSYGGFRFYQSNFRKEDPTYSGILVVKDPGLSVVYTGFVMISLGIIYIFYVRPRVLKARSAARRVVA